MHNIILMVWSWTGSPKRQPCSVGEFDLRWRNAAGDEIVASQKGARFVQIGAPSIQTGSARGGEMNGHPVKNPAQSRVHRFSNCLQFNTRSLLAKRRAASAESKRKCTAK